MTFQTSMAEALRLTRSGDLMQATAALQAALGSTAPAWSGAEPVTATGDVIDLVPEQVSFADKVAPIPKPRPSASPAGPVAGARFEERTYQGSEGTMGYRLYRPAQHDAGMPLVVMLHGCTQTPEDFARGTGMNALADELGFLVAYPRQSPSANMQKCWNWFRPGDQQRDRGEPGLLAAITRQIIAEHEVDPARVYVAGLSAGGAAAAIMAARYPDIFAAAGIHSGLACGAARDMPSAMTAMKRGGGAAQADGRSFVPVITFHGDRDMTVDAVNSHEIVTAATAAAGTTLTVRREDGAAAGRRFLRDLSIAPDGTILIEQWTIAGAGHAWSGGDPAGSYADRQGPDASREMMRFFLGHKRA